MAGASLADGGCSQESAALIEHGLLDDLCRLKQECLRDRQPKRLRCLQVDDEIEFCGLLDGEIGGLRAFQDTVDVPGGPSPVVRDAVF